MSITVRTEGFAELERELERIGRTTAQKASLRRALRKAAEPLAAIAQGMAPVGGTGALSTSVGIGTRLSNRQQRQHRRMFRDDRAAVEVFVGAGPLASAHTQEFGTINHAPQPFMRPAWDQDKMALLERLKAEIRADIERTVARAERRAARLAARRGAQS
jgi:HK97 gp10 family phage protein